VLHTTCLNSLRAIPFKKYITVYSYITCKYNTFSKIWKSFILKSFFSRSRKMGHSKPPVSYCLNAALYFPAFVHTVTVLLLRSFVCICLTETGTVRYWLLRNVAVLHIRTTVHVN